MLGFSKIVLTLVAVFTIVVSCSREDGVPFNTEIAVEEPDSFAQFINRIASLPSGVYTITAATDSIGESGSFTLTVTFDDGEVQTFNGSWASSGGQMVDPGNPTFDFTLYTAGGINISLGSTVNNYLILQDDDGNQVATNDDVSGNSTIALATSRIDSEAYGAAYYAAIDPNDTRTTLEDWKQANGYDAAFNAGKVINARFRDTKDLGYGRGVRVWTNANGFFGFVENFQVRSVPGLEYTTINLFALLNDERQHHFGSNAIEFSTYPYGSGEPSDMGSTHKFPKFYTFDATQGDQTQEDHANETRLNRVDLDGRGDRAMPGACVYCHGGTLRPLRADGTFRDNSYDGTTGNGINGDVNAKLQVLEVPSFEFADFSPFTKAEQEVFIKQINMAIYCTFPNTATPSFCDFAPPPANVTGAFQGNFGRELLAGWYNDPDIGSANMDFGQPTGNQDFDSTFFREDFVPSGWQPDPSDSMPPPGSDQLFLEVVGPNCVVCHSRRGTSFGSKGTESLGKDVNFDSYDKFISHKDQIKLYVYEYGVMPLSLRGFDAFWDSSAPEVLATHIDGFDLINADGSVDRPGAPVADAGPDRTSMSPNRLFGSNSRYTSSYSWSIIDTPVGGEDATLSEASTTRPVLTANQVGEYVIELVASNDSGQSDSDTVTITIDAATDHTALTFTTDIVPIFSDPGPDCVSCHASGAVISIPVWWATGDYPVNGVTLYEEFLARVDFNDPENSLVLTKPSGNHHNGGLRIGFEVDNPANRQHYDTILNWILEGAPQ